MARLTKLSRSIAGKSAIVTGAASGMGRATAHLFADEGALVAVTDLHPDGVEQVVKEIQTAGGDAVGAVLDVRQPGRIEEVVAELTTAFGGLDILVNNAGVSVGAPIGTDGFEEAWELTLDVNLRAQVRMIRACLPFLKESAD